ncbi:hypothetical protein QR680_018513 [Steinernema hermaphroditum]|uniref:Histone H2A n=1 Tax=Steinernema hermaphroditum TaxID=289476 RepID=A0AA39HJ44_9BILA|nr:hypothetical protein QR680_018513 [Steinernema hermaphroditum]
MSASLDSGVASVVDDIDEIVGERLMDGKMFYEVRWVKSFEPAGRVRTQAPQAVRDFELYKQMGRNITIIKYREPEISAPITPEQISNVHYFVSYKNGQQTIVTQKFLETFYPRQLIRFLLPVLADEATQKAMPARADGQKKQTLALRAGLVFNVARFLKRMRKDRYAKQIGPGAGVYITALLEYMTAEILELAGNAAVDSKKSRISPRHIMMAIRHDDELNKLFGHVTFHQGGVLPNIHPTLLNKNSRKATSENLNDSMAKV